MHSKSEVKRTFAIMHLTKKHEQASDKGFCVNFEVAIGVLLVLFNDRSSTIRGHAVRLAEVYKQAY